MSIFPNGYRPISRQQTMGDFPNEKLRAIDGTPYVIKYGNKRCGDQLSLTYRLLRDDVIVFLQHYEENNGTVDRFQVRFEYGFDPNGVMAGTRFPNQPDVLSPAEGERSFRYAQPPQVRQVSRTLFELTVELVQSMV
jgi:hypothetical protein